MTWTPRDYQAEAIEATFDYWATDGGSPLIVIPTGGGKAGVLGTIMRRIFDDFPDMRIVNVAHVAELVEQNYKELLGLWEWAPAGVYSAGLNRRDAHAQILFAGIQSVWNKAAALGPIDLLIIDEAHMVPRKASTTYVKFIEAARELNPDMRILGLTATDYRLDSGRLAEGDDKLFDAIAYEISIRRLIEEGWLTPLVSKATETALSTEGVHRSGGEWVASELQAAVDKDELNDGIAKEIVSYGQNRRSWLVFATGVEHAEHLAERIRARGYAAEVIHGGTPKGERRRIIEDFKAYRLRAIVNCGVLTTGFNHPGLDLIAAARPTESAGLFVQIAGRGTRNVYAQGMPLETKDQRLAAIAAGPKKNCLFLDFAGLLRRHGPIDMVQPRKPGKGGGEAPVKECPVCHTLVHASIMVCTECGHEWERELPQNITHRAAVAPILSTGDGFWRPIEKRKWARHEKFDRPPSVRVDYIAEGGGVFPDWIPFENEKVRWKAEKFWRQCGGLMPVPSTVDDALNRVGELKQVSEIRLKPDGKYWRIDALKFGGDAVDEVQRPIKLGGNLGGIVRAWNKPAAVEKFADILDDDVPF